MNTVNLRNIILCAAAFMVNFSIGVLGAEALLIQSKENPIFSQMWEGIKEEWNAPIEKKVVPEDISEKKTFLKEMSSFPAKIIFVLGENALKEMNSLNLDTPVVFGGAADSSNLKLSDNICGLRFEYSPPAVFNIFKEVFPSLKTAGVIYNPSRSLYKLQEIKNIASGRGIDILDCSASDITDMPKCLKTFSGRIELFWMIMDPVIANKSSFQALVNFSADEEIPLFVPSESIVKTGGFLAVKDDFKNMGKEMAKLAKSIAQGEKTPRDIGVQYPEPQGFAVNKTIWEKLGFKVSEEVFKKADAVY